MYERLGFVPICCEEEFGTKICLFCSKGKKCKKLFDKGYKDFLDIITRYDLDRLVVSRPDFEFCVEPLREESEVVRFE